MIIRHLQDGIYCLQLAMFDTDKLKDACCHPCGSQSKNSPGPGFCTSMPLIFMSPVSLDEEK